MTTMRFCKACKTMTQWKLGVALLNSLHVHSDFPGDFSGPVTEAIQHRIDIRGQTCSRIGPASLIKVEKCVGCGRSVSI